MTTVEKRKILEAVNICVRGDFLSDMEFDQIMQICYVAVDRAFREAVETGEYTQYVNALGTRGG